LLRPRLCRQYFGTNSFLQQQLLQASCNIALLRVDGKDLNVATLPEFVLDLLNQSPFFRVNVVLIKIRRFRNNESLPLARFSIGLIAVKCSKSVGPIGI